MSLEAAAASPASDPATTDEAATAAAATVEAPIDANAASSSDADATDANPPSLLDVLKDAVEKPQAPAGSSTVVGDEVDTEAADAAALAAEGAEDADLPFHNHPRWKQLNAKLDEYREPAGQYGRITEFMNVNGLVPDEVAEGFSVMAAIKSGDPAKLAEVREYFSTRLAFLDETLGNVLPDDLLTRVESGELDDDGAQEIARARATGKLLEAKTARDETRTSEERTAAERTALSTAMVTAVEAWEVKAKATDPDYQKKAELVQDTALAIVQRTGQAPASAEEAVALADQALKEVNGHFKALLPKPRAIVPGPTGASATTVAEPKNLREAINAAVGR